MTDDSEGNPPNLDPLASVVEGAEERLARLSSRRPFTSEGFEVVEASIAEYIRSLVLESSKTANPDLS